MSFSYHGKHLYPVSSQAQPEFKVLGHQVIEYDTLAKIAFEIHDDLIFVTGSRGEPVFEIKNGKDVHRVGASSPV